MTKGQRRWPANGNPKLSGFGPAGLIATAIARGRRRASTIDHLVGAGEQRRGNFQAEDARGLRVDDQLELGGLLDRKVGRLGALENAADIDALLPVRFFSSRRRHTRLQGDWSSDVCSSD